MRILVIKMSSMGDVIHTLPAITDAGLAIENISFDWVVEENFSAIPTWHPLVKNVFPIALRRWRKNIFSAQTRHEWRAFKEKLQSEKYDFIIDAQGLVKSAFIAFLAKGTRVGFDFSSAREGFASFFYNKKIKVPKKQHAINRIRELFSQALDYSMPRSLPNYQIQSVSLSSPSKKYIVFLHGTTWKTKEWSEKYWIELAKKIQDENISVKLPWGTEEEFQRAQRIASVCQGIEILPKLNLTEMKQVLSNATAVVAVDTGLAHLTAALNVPMISLYGSTDPALTGALGKSQHHLKVNFECAPCFQRTCQFKHTENQFDVEPPCYVSLTSDKVWDILKVFIV